MWMHGPHYRICVIANGRKIDILDSILQNYRQEFVMPYVNIRIAGTLSREQKAKIAGEITDTLERIALKPKSYTYVAFDELPDENWAIAGKLLDED
jgi:4-oxalocrotonate tautomerase